MSIAIIYYFCFFIYKVPSFIEIYKVKEYFHSSKIMFMSKKISFLFLIILFSFSSISRGSNNIDLDIPKPPGLNKFTHDLYNQLNSKDLDYKVFEIALKGYLNLDVEDKIENNRYFTIIDMSLSSNSQRFFIIDMIDKKITHQSVVAHGKNSGLEFAKHFSNKVSSYKSSLGFYKTAETYIGKHGLSLRLDGLEFSNNNARKRAIVLHNADYVSNIFIEKNHRLGRSLGCPSLPKKDYHKVIEKIKEGSVLFIYYPNKEYLNRSQLANNVINDRLLEKFYSDK